MPEGWEWYRPTHLWQIMITYNKKELGTAGMLNFILYSHEIQACSKLEKIKHWDPPAQNQDLPPARYSRESINHWRTTIPDTRILTQALGTNYPKATLTRTMAYQCGDHSDALHQHLHAKRWVQEQFILPVTQDDRIMCTGTQGPKLQNPLHQIHNWKVSETTVLFSGTILILDNN